MSIGSTNFVQYTEPYGFERKGGQAHRYNSATAVGCILPKIRPAAMLEEEELAVDSLTQKLDRPWPMLTLEERFGGKPSVSPGVGRTAVT
jgi:hypothetical protein